MKRRIWDSNTKVKVVMEGLSGRPVSEICNEFGIHQNLYYKWRDKLMSEAHKVFDSKNQVGEVERLKRKTAELERIIGSLTVELKKTGDEYL